MKTNKSTVAATAGEFIGQLYGIEREAKGMAAGQRLQLRQERARPITLALHSWLVAQRLQVVAGVPGPSTKRSSAALSSPPKRAPNV
ncbi:IS66 family transposase [Variovorax ginsengisoli]|uniref:IS66 family transposase n=1 Tax=Variovorax ginsengisoli TaxID=363844 RepID=UPI00351FB6CC